MFPFLLCLLIKSYLWYTWQIMTFTNKSHFYDLFPMQELSVEQNAVKTCFISTFVMLLLSECSLSVFFNLLWNVFMNWRKYLTRSILIDSWGDNIEHTIVCNIVNFIIINIIIFINILKSMRVCRHCRTIMHCL